ncbi:DUF4073 domain-containing protein [Cohnella xylanilytica]|uniref:DUF4073 domain-containing protein n=1 Tax=Cohnella xylanilytica TaxID=557555 RepID=A0A841TWG8_9BACL|nr:DUF4073 domain-containing protein [Cohnella xylanilytica]MBB6692525.1 DUF4073 domain-containing protein [Cohnella xylanilytica]
MITLTGLKRFFGLFMASILLLPFIAPSARAAADDGRLVVDPTAYSGIPGFRDMQPTRDGGYVAVGGGRMTKLNAAGEKVWAADALPAETELASLRFVRETSDGGFLFAGSQNLSPAWVVGKLDKNGNQVWRNSNLIYQGEATAIFENSGSYLVIGSNSSNGLQNRDIAIVRVDTNGNTMAGTNFQQPGVQYVRDVLPLDGGGYLLVGDSGSSTEEGFVAKLDENGILIGELRTYGVAGSAFLRIDRLVGHGGYFIMGAVYNSAQNALLLKIDDNLEKEWVQTYSGPTSLSFRTAPTLDGGFIVAGGNNVDQGLLVKVNGTGVRQWDKWLDGGGNLGYVRQADDGSYLAAGGYSQGMLFRVKVGAPSVSADDVHNKIVGLNEKMEYKKEGEPSYTPYDGAAEPTFDGDANVLVRYKRDDAAGYAAGDPIAVVFRANPTADEAASLTDITVAYGTKLADVPLPSQVAVKLSNGDHGTAGVTWNEGTPAYDGNAAGTYTFTGTLTPPEGTTNPDGLKATVRVIVQEKPVVPVTVTEVESLSDLTVAYGTKLADVLLPSQVTVKLSSGDSSTASVTWNEGAPAYDGNAAGTYTFTGTLTPPEGTTNPDGLKATVRVIVQEKPVVPVTVTEVESPSDLAVAYGTKLADVPLPSQVAVKLSNGDHGTAGVTWNEGDPVYDGNAAGTYTFTGTLTPPEGTTNPDGLKATVRVIVQEKPLVPVTVTEVESLSDLTVAYGTKLADVLLPSQVTVKLSSGDSSTASVTWNEGVPAYDGDAAGTYTFTGTLTPPEGVTNPDGLKATVRVIVQEKPVVPVTVTEVASLSELTVAYGTKLADVLLPSQVTVKLSSGDSSTASVTWNEGAPAYNGDTAGAYTFIGTLTPPEGVTNPGGLKATVRVIVQEKPIVPVTVTEVESLSDQTVAYGTKLSDVPLPSQVTVKLSNGDHGTAGVTWNEGVPAYDGDAAGTYTFTGTLTPPEGVTNPGGLKATVRVIVQEKPVVPVTVTEVESLSELTVAYGTKLADVPLPSQVTVKLSNGDHGTASVTWNEGAPAYVGNAAGTYTFTGTLTPPEGATNPGGLKATVRVIVQEKTAEPDPDPIPLTVASVPSLSDIKVPYGTKLSSIPLPAQTEALLSSGDKATVMLTWNDGEPVYNGRKAGTYVFAGTLALPDGISNPAGVQAAVRVIVAKPTVSDSTSATPVQVSERTTSCGAGACSASFGDEVEIYVPEGVFDGSYQLTIRKLGAGSVQVPGELRLLSPVFELLASVAGDFKQPVTLRFKFNPDEIGDARRPALFYYDEKDARWVEVEGRAENAMFVAKVGHFTKFAVFSAEKKEAPEKPEKPEKPIFEDTRNHWAESSIREAAAKGIVQGYSDGRFEPDAPITRAEFTVMLARALGLAAPADNEPAFADASAIGAWARGPIAAAAQAGLATGFADGTFRPGEKINRAEMAAMIARTQKFRSVDAASEPFADEETLPAWVREAAAAVREAGIVTGADGNRFAPNERASRAEAAAMLLRMLDAIAK